MPWRGRSAGPWCSTTKVGAGSTIGAATVACAATGGGTILCGSVGHAAMSALFANYACHPLASFAPVAPVAGRPLVVAVHPDMPASDVPSFVTSPRSRGGEAKFGTVGIGAGSHLAAELLRELTDAGFTVVPCRGTPQAVAELTAGRADFMVDSQTLLAPLMANGRVRGLVP